MGVQTSDSPTVPDNSLVVDRSDRLKQIRARFQTLYQQWSHIHEEAKCDDKFVAGYQWPDNIKKEREDDSRPVLTYNLMLNFVNNITNQIRKDWPQAKVVPVESDRNPAPTVKNITGTKDYSMADVYQGIIRNIEHTSKADQAYDTAVEHSTQHSFGFFRIVTQYANDDAFDQDIFIRRIKNSYNVLLDLSGEEADFSDSNDGFVFTTINKEVFKRKYPGKAYSQFDNRGQHYDGWYDSDLLRIAEYYYIDWQDDEVLLFNDGSTSYHSEVKDILDELEEERGVTVIKRRPVKRKQCKWMKITADEILEGPIDIPCSYVPIFLVIGKELYVDGKMELHSAIRHAKDPQLSYNYWRTAAAETVALAPRAPWLITDDQKAGHQAEWDNANRVNYATLTYNHVEGQPPPQRNYPAQIPAAELSNATQDKHDMNDIVGLHEANLGEASNEKSGTAIRARQEGGNLATFVYPDNLNRAIEHCCRVLIEMIPRVYTTPKIQRIRLPGDVEDFVSINEAIQDKESGEWIIKHDISYGKYDVRIDTGPSYESRRQEATDSMLELMRILPPEKIDAICHLIVKNMDWPGSQDVYEILRKMLPDELKTEEERAKDLPDGYEFNEQGIPVDQQGQPLPEPPPTPEQQMMQRELEVRGAEADAKMEKAEADKAGAQADMAEAQAKIAELQAGVGDGEQAPPVDENAIMLGLEDRLRTILEEHNEQIDEKMTEMAVDILSRVRRAQSQQKQPDSEAA